MKSCRPSTIVTDFSAFDLVQGYLQLVMEEIYGGNLSPYCCTSIISAYFAPTIYDMLDWTELVFHRLKQFNLKIKPKKCQFFNTSVFFLGHVLLAHDISANPKKVEKIKTCPVPKNIKEVQSFLGLASYYRQFINKFAEKVQCLHELVGPTSKKHDKKARTKNPATDTKTGVKFMNGQQSIRMCLIH